MGVQHTADAGTLPLALANLQAPQGRSVQGIGYICIGHIYVSVLNLSTVHTSNLLRGLSGVRALHRHSSRQPASVWHPSELDRGPRDQEA